MSIKYPKASLLVLTIALGTLLNPLNSSMIAVAVTRIQEDFTLTFAAASWLISIFYLASAAGQPVMGKLSDMFGPKKIFMTGLVIVAVASTIAPFSPNFSTLLACRALQAIGSSTLFPSGMAMIRTYITERQAQYLAVVSIFSTTSAAFGPSIGGFLIASWNWPAIFLINFPFVIVSFLLAIFILPAGEKGKVELKRIDFFGIFLFVVTVTCLILFLLSLETDINYTALFICIVGFVIFYMFETRKKEPFIDVQSLKKNKNVTFIYVQFIVINLVFYCYFFGLPAFLQQELQYDVGTTGVIMLALAGASVITAPIAGRLIDRVGSKPPLIIGAIILLIGTTLLLTFRESSPLFWLIIIMVTIGFSAGFNNISTQTALFEYVHKEDTGAASGLFQLSRYLGAILSSSLLGIAFHSEISFEQLHVVAFICIAFCFVIIGFALRLPKRNKV